MENTVERKHRYGKNSRKSADKKEQSQKIIIHNTMPSVDVAVEKKKKKKKHRKPHSLMKKHEADPSDLLEQKVTILDNTHEETIVAESTIEAKIESMTPPSEAVFVQTPSQEAPLIKEETPSEATHLLQTSLEEVPLIEPIKIESKPPSEKLQIENWLSVEDVLQPTATVHVPEFYSQLQFLDDFFRAHQIKYWLNGGTLLGQVRNEKLIPWADCNSIGMSEADGKSCFAELKKSAEKAGYQLWNSVHGLKLRRSKSVSPVTTDIYYYTFFPQANRHFLLSSQPSRKQWPKDYFKEDELACLNFAPFGHLVLAVPTNPTRYLAKLYGDDFLTVARYSSYNHFTGEPRKGLLTFVKIEK